MVLIDPKTGKAFYSRAFDTYLCSDDFDEFTDNKDNNFTDGVIVAAACMDECVWSLSHQGKQWFADMGSKEIWKLEYRCGFAFVGVIGRKEASESRAEDPKREVSVSRVFYVDGPECVPEELVNNPRALE